MTKFKLTLLLILIALTSQAQTKTFIDQPYVEVTGEADTLVTPNEIFIKIILAEKDTKDKLSVEQQEKKMIDALTSLGIPVEKDLTTSDMASNFKSYLFRRKEILKTKEFMLKVSNAQTASRVFLSLEDNGISNTSIDKVSHSRLDAIRNIMRTKAVEQARTSAIALTKPLKQTIGPAIHIMDVQPVRGYASRVAGIQVSGYKRGSSADAEPVIEFEKIPVNANISVKFILKST